MLITKADYNFFIGQRYSVLIILSEELKILL